MNQRLAAIDWRVGAAAVLLLAFAVRFAGIGGHISLDDGYSYLVGSAPSPHAFLARLAGSENTPPLFYLLLTPLPLEHAAWLRLPAAIAGALVCLVLYMILRRPLGGRVALLATLATAVSPFLVTYSNLARGFMLEDLALLLSLWAILRLADGASWTWWALYLLAGVLAVYSEYDAVIFLLALTAAALWIGTPERRRMALLGPLPILALIPWIPQIVRAQHAVGKTKLSPTFAGPSPTSLREATVTLALGEHGGARPSILRWLEFLVIAAALAGALLVLRRAGGRMTLNSRRTLRLIGTTAVLALLGHAIAGLVGIDLFNQRYLTIEIALFAAICSAALVALDRRVLVAAAGAGLLALGVGNLVRRWGHDFEPGLAPVRAAALALHPRTVLTDTPVVVYYLSSLHPQLDRPFNLGTGQAAMCRRPCLIVDDLATRTGTRRSGVPGPSAVFANRYGLILER